MRRPSNKTVWHKRITIALEKLVDEVLNNEEVLKEVYKKINFNKLISSIGRGEKNLLVIG